MCIVLLFVVVFPVFKDTEFPREKKDRYRPFGTVVACTVCGSHTVISPLPR